jgi:hypothetical protein
MLVYYGLARGADSKATAISAATRAIELEPSSSPGHASLAFAVLLFDQDRERAGREFERAIDLNPRYVQGRCWYALFYLQWTRGRFAEGVAHARRALEDDPLSAYPALMLSGCLQATGPLDEAIATGRLAVERDPDSVAARWVLGATLALAGKADDAVTMCQSAAVLSESPVALSGLAFAYAQAGRTADAAGVYEDLAVRAARRYVPLAMLASAAASGGRLEEAVSLARRAWEDREPTLCCGRATITSTADCVTIHASRPSCVTWTPRRGRTSRPAHSAGGLSRRARRAASSDSCKSAGIAIAVASRRIRGVSRYDAMNATQRGQLATCSSMAARTSAGSTPSR